jgi:gas vesicle protein
MSTASKETIQQVKKTFEKVMTDAETQQKQVAPLDGELAKKIQKASEGAKEVVQHIEERSK